MAAHRPAAPAAAAYVINRPGEAARLRLPSQDASANNHKPVLFDNDKRPPWLNWVFLLVFLWSSWQLAGMWFSQLHQG